MIIQGISGERLQEAGSGMKLASDIGSSECVLQRTRDNSDVAGVNGALEHISLFLAYTTGRVHVRKAKEPHALVQMSDSAT